MTLDLPEDGGVGASCGARRVGRSGGRAARVAVRSAPLAEGLRPLRPGMQGGQYSPLTEANVLRIHQAALQALEEIGLSDAPQ